MGRVHHIIGRIIVCLLLGMLALHMGAAEAQSPQPTRAAIRRQADALGELGARLFADPGLSASGRLACVSCHSPAAGFAAPNALPVQMGGADLSRPGHRAAPGLTYLQATPAFTQHFFESEDDGDESIDNGPTGGLTWDGRVDRGRDQARIPLLSPDEMANTDTRAVAELLTRAGYADALARAVGQSHLAPDALFEAAVDALEIYEQDYRVFYPYSSKYDAYLAGKVALSEEEARGLALFEDRRKGNCATCHISSRAKNGAPPQFTDYGLIAIGVPRNFAIPANRDPDYFDLGLCGPDRTDFRDRGDYCGLFKTPSLRNAARRQSFMHNGYFHTLRDVVAFYASRDSAPAKFYPVEGDGTVALFNDLPAAYRANVNTEPPFGQKPGEPPALTDQEIDAIVAFLGTLTDGYPEAGE